MHAPSVGEGLQAKPVLERLRQTRPEVQLAYSWFSPSAERFAASLDVDFRDYLPFDTAADARSTLDALRPTALVFSKLDVWPALVHEAKARGVRLGLVSGTLASGSGRRRRIAAALLRDAYRSLDAVGAVSTDDAARLVELGVRSGAITVTGDTRYDQVWDRAERARTDGPLVGKLRSDRPTLVAGSTWPSDENPLLAALSAVRLRHPRLRLIIAPHEPTAAHLSSIERWARRGQLRLARVDAAAPEHDVLLVDRTGVLGDLYALADMAFVGGGFHSAGLHSVLEPAAFGVPVLFGPRFTNSRDATLLMAAGGGHTAQEAASLERWIEHMLADPDARTSAGVAARELVQRGRGASVRSAALVESLLR